MLRRATGTALSLESSSGLPCQPAATEPKKCNIKAQHLHVHCMNIFRARRGARSQWPRLLSSSRRPLRRPMISSVRRRMRTFRPIPYRTLACFLARRRDCIPSPVLCTPLKPHEPYRCEDLSSEPALPISHVCPGFNGHRVAFDCGL